MNVYRFRFIVFELGALLSNQSYGNAGFDKALSLLEAYVGHTPTREELQRLYFHRSFQCLQWYNVAIFKDRVGLSRDLNMDFNEVASFFFNMAKDLADQYDKL